MVAFLAQENLTQHEISIPPQSCLQCRRRPVTSRVIDPPQARKYHAILEYSRGRWPTVCSPLSTLVANTKLSMCNEFFTNLSHNIFYSLKTSCRNVALCLLCPLQRIKKLPHFFALLPVSSLPSSDIMPGYTASHSACKKISKLMSVFYASVLLLIMNFVITLSSCGSMRR